jgi:hypothetical protein
MQLLLGPLLGSLAYVIGHTELLQQAHDDGQRGELPN